MLHKLIFDATDPDVGHNVGAFLRSSNGDLISSGDGASDNVANTFEGLDTRGFLFGYDSTGGNWDRLQSTAGSLNVNITSPLSIDVNLTQADEVTVFQGTSPWVVSATNLDIRDLAFATDKVDVSGSSVSITGDVNVTQGTSPWIINATDLDIRDLTHVSDSVRLGDGTGYFTSTTVGGDIGLDIYQLNDPELANGSMVAAANTLSVANTAQNLVASPLSNRKYLFVYNNTNKTAYIGGTGVTTASGYPMVPGSEMHLRAGSSVDVEWVSTVVPSGDMRTLELA